MTLVSKLRQKLSDERPSADRHDLQVTDEEAGSAVTLAITRRDELSTLFWEINLRRKAPVSQDLRQWAERLPTRVTSLLEPLQVLEIDALRNQAMLRSTPSVEAKTCPTYFEVILDGTTSASVRRYQAGNVVQETGHVARRDQVAFALTHEGLLKLVADLTTP